MRYGIPNNVKRNHLGEEGNAARMLLCSMGYSDALIAHHQGTWFTAIQKRRGKKGLPRHPKPIVNKASNRTRDTVFDRVRRAIGRYLPRDIADDAASDLYLAVLSGSVDIGKLEKVARKFGNRAFESFASKYGPRSLDADIGDSEGFTLLDTLRDESSSSWLEEMGATVW